MMLENPQSLSPSVWGSGRGPGVCETQGRGKGPGVCETQGSGRGPGVWGLREREGPGVWGLAVRGDQACVRLKGTTCVRLKGEGTAKGCVRLKGEGWARCVGTQGRGRDQVCEAQGRRRGPGV